MTRDDEITLSRASLYLSGSQVSQERGLESWRKVPKQYERILRPLAILFADSRRMGPKRANPEGGLH